jgi:hypothetical protein
VPTGTARVFTGTATELVRETGRSTRWSPNVDVISIESIALLGPMSSPYSGETRVSLSLFIWALLAPSTLLTNRRSEVTRPRSGGEAVSVSRVLPPLFSLSTWTTTW